MKSAMVLIVVALLAASLQAQERLVETGPFGAPAMVADEAGAFSTAIMVFENADLAYFIPDITREGWRDWYIPGFQQTGKYPVRIYKWYKTTKECESWPHPNVPQAEWARNCSSLGFKSSVVVIDTRHQTVHGLWSVFVDNDGNDDIRTLRKLDKQPDEQLATTTKPFQAAIARITKIVENESKGGRGK